MRTGLRIRLYALVFSSTVLVTLAVGSRAVHAHRLPQGWLRAALCVHSHEGSWRDSGAPYWGGLQMDMTFMRNYGSRELRRWGTADHWSPHTQLDVAYRGWKVQGWSAWPNTARMCGLL